MGPPVVFLGPTLPRKEAARLYPAEYWPPVSQGDVVRAARLQPRAIVIIDGYFNRVPAVWHKEILAALADGIPVFGCSSMGALRAAELHPFGMVGIGHVFEQFRDGILEDDDEVALVHGPPEFEFRPLSEAMVNIRQTLKAAATAGVIGECTHMLLCAIAKRLYYPERNYRRIVTLAFDAADDELAEEATGFGQWVNHHAVDQKRADAVELLSGLAAGSIDPGAWAGPEALEPTAHWLELKRLAGVPSRQNGLDAQALEGERLTRGLALLGADLATAKTYLRERRLSLDEAARHDYSPTPETLGKRVLDFRARRGLLTKEQLWDWLAENDLDIYGLTRLALDEARVAWARDLVEEESTALLSDLLRVHGVYSKWVQDE